MLTKRKKILEKGGYFTVRCKGCTAEQSLRSEEKNDGFEGAHQNTSLGKLGVRRDTQKTGKVFGIIPYEEG